MLISSFECTELHRHASAVVFKEVWALEPSVKEIISISLEKKAITRIADDVKLGKSS